MQIRYVLADFELSYFFQNKNSLELLSIVFENDSPKGSFGANKKKVEFLLLSPDSRKLLISLLNIFLLISWNLIPCRILIKSLKARYNL